MFIRRETMYYTLSSAYMISKPACKRGYLCTLKESTVNVEGTLKSVKRNTLLDYVFVDYQKAFDT